MSVFNHYAHYYDLLYRDKDYKSEVDFVIGLLTKHDVKESDFDFLLELGCGTGRHAAYFADRGYRVHGVDLSADMVAQAKSRLDALPHDVASRLQFSQGDVRSARVNQIFSAVISLFHVVSYQSTNEDLLAMFDTTGAHLDSGGIFLFDCWYGPAVLTDRPTVRVKRLADEKIDVLRIAEPVMYPNDNLVDVNYTVLITDKGDGAVEKITETHRMRYLFLPEVELMLDSSGFELVDKQQWLGDDLGFGSWAAVFVAKKR